MVSLVKDNLLKNLDDYATAFGWDKWPAAQLAQNRVGTDGTRGAGSLYAAGLNYSLTGVFYNKDAGDADRHDRSRRRRSPSSRTSLPRRRRPSFSRSCSGTPPPAAPDWPSRFSSSWPPTAKQRPINDWIFQKSGATIDTPTNVTAAQHLQQWIEAGYFPKDANAIEYTDANARFGKGEGVFMFNGDWQNAVYDKDLSGNVGFFVFPSGTDGGPVAAMSAPLTYGIAANAKNADCAAAFFNWVATNETARQVDVAVGGSNPGGPTDLAIPPAAAGSITNDTLAAGGDVAKANGAMDFIANATGQIFAQGWTPELQKMVGGKQTPEGLLKAVQAEYEKELAQ